MLLMIDNYHLSSQAVVQVHSCTKTTFKIS
jgi:hypothetical protein